MLLPIKKILSPTDFSDPSYEALKIASELALNFNARLYLAHIVPEIPHPYWAIQFPDGREAYEPGLSEYEEALHARALEKLEEVIRERLPKEIESHAIVRKGEAANGIARVAEDERMDLIVIATHGMTGWRQIAFGSVTERVVRLSGRPVLTIHAPRIL
ncbi:MAG: universal stress protein [Blastocatellia bacterium]|nr:universal stress protein [Blastocatellia bacterium]